MDADYVWKFPDLFLRFPDFFLNFPDNIWSFPNFIWNFFAFCNKKNPFQADFLCFCLNYGAGSAGGVVSSSSARAKNS